MLKFAQYRKAINEEESGPENAPDHMKPYILSVELQHELSKIIDSLVADLKRQLVNPMTPDAQRGVWDRIKNWWSNQWHGRYNQENPYFWQNKLGDDLGRRVEATTLEDYNSLKKWSTLLESQLPPGTEKLQIVKTIDSWAANFKQAIINMVANKISHEHEPLSHPEETPTQPPTPSPVKSDPDEENQPLPDGEEKPTGRTAPLDPNAVGSKPAPTPVSEPEPTAATATEPAAPEEAGLTGLKHGKWTDLQPHEQDMWDKAGGGPQTDKEGKAKRPSFRARAAGLRTLPWILRLGDPRIPVLQNIRSSHLYDALVNQGRIEKADQPIKNDAQLATAVAIAKTNSHRDWQAHSETNRDRWKRKNAGPRPPEQTPESTPEPEAEVEPTGRTAPMTMPPNVPSASASDAAEPLKTASMGHEPVPDDEKKQDLMSRIDSLSEDDGIPDHIKNILRNWVNRGDFERAEKQLSYYEKAKDSVDDDEELPTIEATILDKIAFYRSKLRNRPAESKLLVNRGKLRELNHGEKVDYLKSLLKG